MIGLQVLGTVAVLVFFGIWMDGCTNSPSYERWFGVALALVALLAIWWPR